MTGQSKQTLLFLLLTLKYVWCHTNRKFSSHGLLFQWASTKNPTTHVGLWQGEHHHRLYRLIQMKIILAKKDRAEKFLTWNWTTITHSSNTCRWFLFCFRIIQWYCCALLTLRMTCIWFYEILNGLTVWGSWRDQPLKI
jgi:hypothetical protein